MHHGVTHDFCSDLACEGGLRPKWGVPRTGNTRDPASFTSFCLCCGAVLALNPRGTTGNARGSMGEAVAKAKHYDTPGSQGISHPVLKGLNGG